MERNKVIDIEEFKARKLEELYADCRINRGGKLRKKSTSISGKVDDLVDEIEKDERSLFREGKVLNDLYVRGEYVLEED